MENESQDKSTNDSQAQGSDQPQAEQPKDLAEAQKADKQMLFQQIGALRQEISDVKFLVWAVVFMLIVMIILMLL